MKLTPLIMPIKTMHKIAVITTRTRQIKHSRVAPPVTYRFFGKNIQFIIKQTSQMKNTTELKGNWNESKGKLKQKFAMLTDDDLLLQEGKQDELIGRLQVKLGKTKDEIHQIIADL